MRHFLSQTNHPGTYLRTYDNIHAQKYLCSEPQLQCPMTWQFLAPQVYNPLHAFYTLSSLLTQGLCSNLAFCLAHTSLPLFPHLN